MQLKTRRRQLKEAEKETDHHARTYPNIASSSSAAGRNGSYYIGHEQYNYKQSDFQPFVYSPYLNQLSCHLPQSIVVLLLIIATAQAIDVAFRSAPFEWKSNGTHVVEWGVESCEIELYYNPILRLI